MVPTVAPSVPPDFFQANTAATNGQNYFNGMTTNYGAIVIAWTDFAWYYSNDYGTKYKQSSYPGNLGAPVDAYIATNNQDGVILGSTGMAITHDGGKTFSSNGTALPAWGYLNTNLAVSDNLQYIYVLYSNYYQEFQRSSDYGKTFVVESAYCCSLYNNDGKQRAIATSLSGQYVLVPWQGAGFMVSSNYAVDFYTYYTTQTGYAALNYAAVSSTGQYMVATVENMYVSGSYWTGIYRSGNYGQSFFQVTSTGGYNTLQSYKGLSMDGTGQYIYLVQAIGSPVILSSNYGGTWQPANVPLQNASLYTGVTVASGGMPVYTSVYNVGLYYHGNPTAAPTFMPTFSPTAQPTTSVPTVEPTASPSALPSVVPSSAPSAVPSESPSAAPSNTPQPSEVPTASPSVTPTAVPSSKPSLFPTTTTPSITPTVAPSTEKPSRDPTSSKPTSDPTFKPSFQPTFAPSITDQPTAAPTTTRPSHGPTTGPSLEPTFGPSHKPSHLPTVQPSVQPTMAPTLASVLFAGSQVSQTCFWFHFSSVTVGIYLGDQRAEHLAVHQ